MNTNTHTKAPAKTKIILLSGFLGSGKTTLLKRILSWETDLSDTAVMVNEFGDVGIDGALLEESGTDVIELTSGCICCTLSADMNRALVDLLDRYGPTKIMIESTGVADPSAIVSVLGEAPLRDRVVMDKIITVLDTDVWEAREVFGPLFYHQLEIADVILLNKIDLMDTNRVPSFLAEIHEVIGDTRVVPTIQCRIDPETLWTVSKPRVVGLKTMEFFQKKDDPVDASNYTSFIFESESPLDGPRFEAFLNQLPFEMFRIKGPVRFSERTMMLNYVGGRADWTPWEPGTHTQLAFIGWRIDCEDILKKARTCIVASAVS